MNAINNMFVLHSESMGMCLVLIVFLFIMELSTRQGTTWRSYLPLIYVSVMILLVIDAVWYVIDGRAGLAVLHKVLQTVYLILYPILGWTWFTYCAESFRKFNIIHKRWFKVLKYSTIIINAVLVILSWKFGIIYIVDEGGKYTRGPLIMFTNGIMYLTMIFAAVLSLIESFCTSNGAERKHFIALASYVVPVLVMGLAQLLSPPGITSAYFGFVITFAMILIDSLKQQITLDSLTGMNNSRTIEHMTQDRMNRFKAGDTLVIGLFDIDGFKQINDTLGHAKGDEAIIAAGRSIERVCRKYGAHCSRLHGDEYLVLIDNGNVPAEIILADISDAVKKDSADLEYPMTVSYGSAGFAPGMTAKTIFEIADNNLYEHKRSKRIVRDSSAGKKVN